LSSSCCFVWPLLCSSRQTANSSLPLFLISQTTAAQTMQNERTSTLYRCDGAGVCLLLSCRAALQARLLASAAACGLEARRLFVRPAHARFIQVQARTACTHAATQLMHAYSHLPSCGGAGEGLHSGGGAAAAAQKAEELLAACDSAMQGEECMF
jgi:hypothetical protein